MLIIRNNVECVTWPDLNRSILRMKLLNLTREVLKKSQTANELHYSNVWVYILMYI